MLDVTSKVSLFFVVTVPLTNLPSASPTLTGSSARIDSTADHLIVTVPAASVFIIILSPSFFTIFPESRSPFFSRIWSPNASVPQTVAKKHTKKAAIKKHRENRKMGSIQTVRTKRGGWQKKDSSNKRRLSNRKTQPKSAYTTIQRQRRRIS